MRITTVVWHPPEWMEPYTPSYQKGYATDPILESVVCQCGWAWHRSAADDANNVLGTEAIAPVLRAEEFCPNCGIDLMHAIVASNPLMEGL